MIRLADYVIDRVQKAGAKHVFMVTGRGILYLTDAVAKNQEIDAIAVHHEQSGAYAATAYAQYNDEFGACLVSTGCASTNALTGVLNAWQDGVPCIFISGQNKLNETVRHTGVNIRTFGSQEADIIPIVEPITKYATMIEDPNKIAYEMDKAIYHAQHGRKGPVWIDIPVDVQNMRVDPESLERFDMPEDIEKPEDGAIDYVMDALEKSERPVLLIGNGIRSAGYVEAFKQFIEESPFPVTFSNSAVDIYGAGNDYSIGTVGTLGATRAGNFAVQNADLLLVLGCRLSPITTGSDYDKFARDAKVIVVDIDPDEHSKNTVEIDKMIMSDVGQFLSTLKTCKIKSASDEWLNKCKHWKEIFPRCEKHFENNDKIDLYYLSEILSRNLKSDSTIVTDAGLEELIVPSTVGFHKDQRCIHPASQGSMGYALPAAIGAHYSSSNEVIAVIGDGSIMMNLQELQTIKHHDMKVKIIIVNNDAYSVIRSRQENLFRTRTIGTDSTNGVSCPEYRKIADAFEIPYMSIDSKEGLNSGMIDFMKYDGPVICEVYTDENQRYIHSSYTLNSKRRMVNRPLEDQSPFLDRDLFLKEMVIEPIDQ